MRRSGRNRTYRFSLFSLRCSFPPRRRRTNVLEDEGASGGLSIYLFHCTVCISHLSSHNLHNELFQVKSVTKLSLVLICVLSVSLAVMQQSAAEKERGRSGQFGKRKYKSLTYFIFPPFSRTREVKAFCLVYLVNCNIFSSRLDSAAIFSADMRSCVFDGIVRD